MLKSKAAWALSRPGGRWTYNRKLDIPAYSQITNLVKIKYLSSSQDYLFLGLDAADPTVSRYVLTKNLRNWTFLRSILNFVAKDIALGPSNAIAVGTYTLPGFSSNVVSISGFTQTPYSVFPYSAGIVTYWAGRSRFVHMREFSAISYGTTVPTTNASPPGFNTPDSIAVRNGAYPLCVSSWRTNEELILNVGSNGTSYVDDSNTYVDLTGLNGSPGQVVYSAPNDKFYWAYAQSPAGQLIITTEIYEAPTTTLSFVAKNVATLPSISTSEIKSMTICEASNTLILLLTTGQVLISLDFGLTWGISLSLSADYIGTAFGPAGVIVVNTPENFITSP